MLHHSQAWFDGTFLERFTKSIFVIVNAIFQSEALRLYKREKAGLQTRPQVKTDFYFGIFMRHGDIVTDICPSDTTSDSSKKPKKFHFSRWLCLQHRHQIVEDSFSVCFFLLFACLSFSCSVLYFHIKIFFVRTDSYEGIRVASGLFSQLQDRCEYKIKTVLCGWSSRCLHTAPSQTDFGIFFCFLASKWLLMWQAALKRVALVCLIITSSLSQASCLGFSRF